MNSPARWVWMLRYVRATDMDVQRQPESEVTRLQQLYDDEVAATRKALADDVRQIRELEATVDALNRTKEQWEAIAERDHGAPIVTVNALKAEINSLKADNERLTEENARLRARVRELEADIEKRDRERLAEWVEGVAE